MNVPSSRADGLRSGRRLRIRYAASADGAQVPVGLWDDTNKVGCHAGTAADGKRRCILDGASEAPYFQDAACKVRLYMAPPCSEADAFGTTQTGCGWRVFKLQPVATPGMVYTEQGLTCLGMPLPAELGTYTFYARGAELPASELIELTDGVGAPQ